MNIVKSKWGVAAIAGVLVIGGGFAATANAAEGAPEPVRTVQPYQNGLAGEDEAEAAAAVATQAAEVARVAAEAQAMAEAQAVADAEAQAAAEAQAVVDATVPVEVIPEPESDPTPWVPSADPENANGGDWDLSSCPNGASTGADGMPHCD